MFLFNFITSQTGAQYIYIGLAISNALLICNIWLAWWLARPQRYIVVRDSGALFAVHSFFEMIAFFLTIYITGAHPMHTAKEFAPYIRLAWFAMLVTFAPATLRMTMLIIRTMWSNAHERSN